MQRQQKQVPPDETARGDSLVKLLAEYSRQSEKYLDAMLESFQSFVNLIL